MGGQQRRTISKPQRILDAQYHAKELKRHSMQAGQKAQSLCMPLQLLQVSQPQAGFLFVVRPVFDWLSAPPSLLQPVKSVCVMATRGGQNVGDKTGPQASHCDLRHSALKDLRLYFGIFAAFPKMDTNPGVCRLLTFGSP